MSKRKINNPFEQVDGLAKGMPFSVLSDKQARSKTWQKLSDHAKYTLMVCRLCRQYHTGKDAEGKSRAINGSLMYFHFSRATQIKYGLKNPNKVRKQMIELVSSGFIDVVECNAHRKQKNVYAFSSKWQMLDAGQQIELSPGAKTFIQGLNRDKTEGGE